MTDQISIPAAVANHVLWTENRGGYEPGSFTKKLLAAWPWADDANSARLAAGWPEYAAAFRLFGQADGKGYELLQSIASGEHNGRVPCPAGPVDLSEWATEIGTDGLEPLASSLSMRGTPGPIARILFAVRPDMPEALRDHLVMGVGEQIAKFLPST